MPTPMDAHQLRSAFTRFFEERGHVPVPSASLIPHDPTVMFTIAGMVPFKPYFTGDEQAPWPRATSVQKCFRTVDIDIVGRTARHATFFEMLGNFSFGDYFKDEAIPFAWELITGPLGLEADRLWVTVHDSDDEAEEIWHEAVGVPAERIQRMGEDNFWRMGDTGPCGPCSEIYFDKGERYGEGGGPAHGGADRFVELWNLVFMQYSRSADGLLDELPRRNIDTGAGLERILAVLEGVDSIFDTDAYAPMLGTAQSLTGKRYGDDPEADVGLRILADHGRAMTMLVADGVLPSNEGRGSVLRRIIRRTVRWAGQLGAQADTTGTLAGTVISAMADSYPALRSQEGFVTDILAREEDHFRRTLAAGSALFEEELAKGSTTIPGDVAFRLHDTFGFPVELTVELAAEAGVTVDLDGFDAAMREQRDRARQAAKRNLRPAGAEAYRSVLDEHGPTAFVGYERDSYAVPTRIVAVLVDPDDAGQGEIFLDHTPFYAEGGGQVGDTGTIVTETGKAEVLDTRVAVAGLVTHRVRLSGEILPGQDALAAIDGARREAIRRNHTATHLLHAGLRAVLGDHVRQQGSLVAPDRLRFDFSHHGPLRPEELSEVTAFANGDVLEDAPVETMETSKAEAEAMGALAFFGDKYGELVRVVRAGRHSTEFCGGTHVHALGEIGPISIVSESSIGSNTRRIEALTGRASLDRFQAQGAQLEKVSELLRTEPSGLVDAVERLLDRQRVAERELQAVRAKAVEAESATLAGEAVGGAVVARRDGVAPDALRDLAQAARRHGDLRAVVLVGSPDGAKVAVAGATGASGPNATELIKRVAAVVGGGGGGSAELAVAGGRDVGRLEEALAEARRALDLA